MGMYLTIAGIFIVLALVALIIVDGASLVDDFFPSELLHVGDQVEIFLDGVYNRTATITGVTTDKIFIYDTLPLPLDYRGKFYGVGYDADGVEFWYLKDRKRNHLVPIAEFLRVRYHRLSNPYQLEPVTSENDILTAVQKQKAESEQIQNTEETEQ